METHITIPHTDMKASRIALGTVNAGLNYDGPDADHLFDLYLDLGGNVIDSARVYFDWVLPEKGRSERVIGDWFRREKKRDRVILITKGGHPDKDTMHVSRMGQQDMEYDINLSLKSLGADYIDIYFYHRDDPTQTVGELLERMEGFRRAGKIRYYGCSNWTTVRMIEADTYTKEHSLRGFIANQMLFNYGSKYMKPFSDDTMVTMDSAMMEYHTKNADNVAMPYFGLCNGFFHLLTAGQEEKVKDSPYYTQKNLELAERLKSLCQKYTASISQILMGFYMVQDFAVIPLAGAVNGEELKDAMGTLRFNFEAKDFIMI
jgi:aryl-alcohol dehydrogenase-like predicted oxidoreductase